MTISLEWRTAIDDYIASMRAGGAPLTSQNTRRQHLQHLARRVEAEPWALGREQLVAWAAEQSWSNQTRHTRRMSFLMFYRWAKHSGRTKHNPAKGLPKVSVPMPAPRPCPERVYMEALMRADDRQQVALKLAHDHGLRRAEIAVVHSGDLFEDLVGYSLVVHGKGSKVRNVPLTGAMAELLRQQPAGYVFEGDDNGHLSPRWLGKIVNRTLEAPWTIHTLRHSFATRIRRASDLYVAQELLGHASSETTRRYTSVERSELRAAVVAIAS